MLVGAFDLCCAAMSPRRRPLDETLLAFAGINAAELSRLDPDELDSRVQLALLVWNAVLLADEEAAEARGSGEDGEAAFEAVVRGLIDDIRTSLGPAQEAPDGVLGEGGGDDEIETLVRHLVVRKLEQHLSDTRALAEAYLELHEGAVVGVVVTEL